MIYILSDKIETGKSSTLLKWTQGRNDIFGILTPRGENNIRYILDLATKECFEMQTDLETADAILVGRYRFLKTAFEKVNGIIKKALKNNKSGYIIIDELGKLELHSRGFHESASLAITTTINSNDLHLILIIRNTLLLEIVKKYNITNYQYIAIEKLNESAELILKSSVKSNF